MITVASHLQKICPEIGLQIEESIEHGAESI
jgi:hypothetical protein